MSLENFQSAIESAWVATTPPDDGSDAVYSFIDTLIEERGAGRHREMIWLGAEDQTTADTASTQYLWTAPCELFLERNNRTDAQFKRDINREIATLRRAHDQLTALGSGVYEATLAPISPEDVSIPRPSRAGGVQRNTIARVRFSFDVLAGSQEIASSAMAFGQIVDNTGSAALDVQTAGIYVVLEGGSGSLTSSDSRFSMPTTGQLRYDGTVVAAFRLDATVTVAAGATDRIRRLSFGVNGSRTGPIVSEAMASTGGQETISLSTIVQLQPGDTAEIMGTSDDDEVITINTYSFIAQQIQ